MNKLSCRETCHLPEKEWPPGSSPAAEDKPFLGDLAAGTVGLCAVDDIMGSPELPFQPFLGLRGGKRERTGNLV